MKIRLLFCFNYYFSGKVWADGAFVDNSITSGIITIVKEQLTDRIIIVKFVVHNLIMVYK